MVLGYLRQRGENCWEITQQGTMRVPAVIYADATLLQAIDQKVFKQLCNVTALPGIVEAAYVMPDANWGYGFPTSGSMGASSYILCDTKANEGRAFSSAGH